MKRSITFDVLNILCCFCVVVMHGNGVSWVYADDSYWYQSFLIDVICYFAVPCFFMITGATLLEYRTRYNTKTFIKKRIIRTLIPYIFWAWFYLLLHILLGDISINSLFNWNENGVIYHMWHSVIDYSSQPIFWYFPVLFNVYICIPVISNLIGDDRRDVRRYTIIIAFITVIFIPSIYHLRGNEWGHDKQMYCLSGYLIYVLVGYHFIHEKISKKVEYFIYIIAVICILIKYIGTVYLSKQINEINQAFYGYLTIWAFFPSLSVYLLINKLQNIKLSESMKRVLKELSSCSLGIYFIHKLLFSVLNNVIGWSEYSALYRYIGVLLVYVFGVAIVLIIKKIPVVKIVVP